MIFHETGIPDVLVVEAELRSDERGFFARTWCRRDFRERGLNPDLVQASLSFSPRAGTLRGLHWQAAPSEEAKLVRCTRGAIYDVAVDLRPGSRTYRQWLGETLSAQKYRMLYLPEGVAHGFLTLADDTEVTYQMSQYHDPASQRGARYDDPAFRIRWPAEVRVISDRDAGWSDYLG